MGNSQPLPPWLEKARQAGLDAADLQGPPGDPYDNIRVWTFQGKPVIYEYSSENLRDKRKRLWKDLTYLPRHIQRPYYQIGDVVLLAPTARRDVEDRFPQLKYVGTRNPTALQSALGIALTLLGMDRKEYLVGWQITDIWGAPSRENPDSVAYITLQGIVFFGDLPIYMTDEILPGMTEEPVSTWSLSAQDLNLEWGKYRLRAKLHGLREIIEGPMADIISLGLGVARAGTKYIRKKIRNYLIKEALIYVAKEIFKEMLRESKKAAEQAAIRSAAPLGAALAAGLVAASQSGRRPDLSILRQKYEADIKRAIQQMATAFAEIVMQEALKSGALARMIAAFCEVLDLNPKLFEEHLKKFLARKLDIHGEVKFDDVVKLVEQAVLEAWPNNGPFAHQKFLAVLQQKLVKLVTDLVLFRADHWAVEFAGQV